MKAKIIGAGNYLPDCIVTNQDLETIIDTSDEWIVQRTGIKERRYSKLTNSQMGYQAALKALENAKVDKDDLDMIIVATVTPDQPTPGAANLIHGLLELKNDIPSFDIGAACTGFIFGLKTAQAFIESGQYKRILLIAVEHLSKMIDFSDRSTAVLFGDGARSSCLRG